MQKEQEANDGESLPAFLPWPRFGGPSLSQMLSMYGSPFSPK